MFYLESRNHKNNFILGLGNSSIKFINSWLHQTEHKLSNPATWKELKLYIEEKIYQELLR